jgi:4-amino-4-deoxy-L-arabinose transferase-like glycosyltransferase
MILATGLSFRLIGDEGVFHIRVIQSFASTWPRINIADYPSASAPLPYVLLTIFGRIAGFEIWKLRLLPAIATYLAVNLFYNLCKRHELRYPLLSTLILLFFPYIFFHGFTIYTEGFALLFGVWAMNYYLLNDATLSQLLRGSILATLAVYCRQSYLVLPGGMLLFELWQTYRHGFVRSVRQRLGRLIILVIPAVMLLPLFSLWGGFTTPFNQASQGGGWFLELVPQQLNFLFVFIGFYFLPMLFGRHTIELARSKKAILLALVILLPLYFVFPVVFSDDPGRINVAAGIIAHGLDIIGRFLSRNVAFVAELGFWTVGLLITLGECMHRPRSEESERLAIVTVTTMMLLTLTPYVYERYYILVVPFLVLLFHRSFQSRGLLFAWLAVQILLSAGFSYWQIALKSFESWY